MDAYCTVDEARTRQRVDDGDSDADVTAFIEAASESIRLHIRPTLPWEMELDSSGNPVLDSAGNPIYVEDSSGVRQVRPLVKQATLYLLGCYFKDRDGQQPELWPQNSLPLPVVGMLCQLREPILR